MSLRPGYVAMDFNDYSKAEHQSQHYRLEDELLKRYPEQIKVVTERIAGIEKDIVMYNEMNEELTDIQTSLTSNAATITARLRYLSDKT